MSRCAEENRDDRIRELAFMVTNAEKHFGKLCQIFAAYTRKTARVRDKGDLLASEIKMYAATETPTLKQGLQNFAKEFAKIQDYRQAQIERFESKIVKTLRMYGIIIKMKREDLKAQLASKSQEIKQRMKLEKTRRQSPWNRCAITQAELKLQRAETRSAQSTQYLLDNMDNFQRQKLKDIKYIFSEFITIEMLFFGRALEFYTAAYKSIQNIDEEKDFEFFQTFLCPSSFSVGLGTESSRTKAPPLPAGLDQDKFPPAIPEKTNKPKQKVKSDTTADESPV
uniref:protein FAM92A-like n=1 Tax=Jaculus jaculus TaxID=51337 RepID=UPI001E1B1B4B|nr:protein FAM92A-like [Jaculus jaculus]